ncbi:transposase [Kineosporia sp. J2-2]|uniref:Transposase n=1 Tax=Kineosporia corallincola TaxID=2835133 RepID=A0ABS5TPD8_9ACTN|nr:transposase [Kineosporia corallincola]
MEAAQALEQPPLRSFGTGLRQDQVAVTAALSLEYSNGPTEGTNTKIKLLKRQMYGRAGSPRFGNASLLNRDSTGRHDHRSCAQSRLYDRHAPTPARARVAQGLGV